MELFGITKNPQNYPSIRKNMIMIIKYDKYIQAVRDNFIPQ